jgi:site-specific DNA-methyltransferase (adenine-specific)
MIPFPNKKYSIIYADPPWSYGDRGFGKRPNGSLTTSMNPESGRYNTMTLLDIMRLPVRKISNRNSVLLLWATSPLLPEALHVMQAWGYLFKTVAFVWSKITSTGKEVANLGQYTLGNVEYVLLGTKGSLPRQSRCVRQLVTAERTEHSAKPDEVKNRIVELYGNVPRIELFARSITPGWDVWGNEV